MWMVWVLGLFLFAAPVIDGFGFDEKYERDYNTFNNADRHKLIIR